MNHFFRQIDLITKEVAKKELISRKFFVHDDRVVCLYLHTKLNFWKSILYIESTVFV